MATPKGTRNTPGRPNKRAPRDTSRVDRSQRQGRPVPANAPAPPTGLAPITRRNAAQTGKAYLKASFGYDITASGGDTSGKAVLDYYRSLPKAQRAKAYSAIANAVNNRDFSNWSNPFYSTLLGDLSPGARAAFAKARGGSISGRAGGTSADQPPILGEGGTPGTESFATGVSGATQQFIREKGTSRYKAGEAETNTTKKKKKGKAQRKKLVRRVVKKTDVKGKAVRRALRSPGVTAADKKVYKKVAKQASPKLSSRLRQRDRRGK